MNHTFLKSLSLCAEWLPINHIFFQLANACLLLSYISPNGIYGLIYLRSCLALGSLFFSLWGYLILCSPDTTIWNAFFTLINLFHIVILIWSLHPFIRFPHDVEMVYRDLFKPLKVSRSSFKKIYSCTREILTLKSKDFYAVERKTLVDKLSLLLCGKVGVMQGRHTLHIIDSHQFLDSPEWFGVGSHSTYQVSIVALEESRLLIWNRDKLKLTISSDPYLQAVLDNILGKDVVKKLLLVTDTISNRQISSNEHTKLIVPSHCAMDQLIKRNPSRDANCFWNFSHIESNAETSV